MNDFFIRTMAWKQLIIRTMLEQVSTDERLTVQQKNDTKEKIKGPIGDRLAMNRIAKALGISVVQLEKRLIRQHVRRQLKPGVIR